MTHTHGFGLIGFLGQTDLVGKAILLLLLAMSLVSWYLIVTKAASALAVRRRAQSFLESFWAAPSIDAVAAKLDGEAAAEDPFSQLAWHAVRAQRHHEQHGAKSLGDSGAGGEFLTRALRRVIDEETAQAESGLTLLASVGSTAPFIGLFGTVWGVYHALVEIGMSGQGTLDKVAGPVGEALIMTAAGLAVAVPAVLAYNAFTRENRIVLARLDGFAHDLFALLTTGAHVSGQRGTGA